VLNVATGRSVAIREVLATLADIAGARFRPYRDPALIRDDDPPEIVGDASRLRDVTGWRPSIPLRRTLADLVASIEAGR
jgi:nucleoside-diphosphate-sugar epimerase